MNCDEAREFLFAFLDNELDAPLSIELQRHIERCCDCAREAETERAVRKQLVATLEDSATVGALDEGKLTRMLTSSGRRPVPGMRLRTGRRWRVAAGIAVLVLGGAGVIVALKTSQSTAPFADLLVADFQHFLEEGRQLQLASADASEVSRWLHDRTGLDVAIAPTHGRRCRLVGARKCKIAGRPAAFAFYDVHGDPVSFVAVEQKHVNLSRMRYVGQGSTARWVDLCKGHTVVARSRGQLLYAAVSKLPETELFDLMESVINESD
jgi:anti-sigma factor RsiW